MFLKFYKKKCTSYELMKIWFNSNHSKIINYQLIKVLKEKVLDMNLSSQIRTHIESLIRIQNENPYTIFDF
jgi:hypothetical protein